MNKKKTGLRLGALALIAVVSLSACGTPTPAQTEQSIVVYSGRSEELVEGLFAAFTEETGINIEARYGDSAELATQILEEGQNIRADVFFSQDAGALGALALEGVLKTLPPETTDLVADAFKSPDGEWVGVSGRARVMVINPDKVTKIPSSYMDLMDPSWKGRIAIAPTNASFQAFITAIRILDGEPAATNFLAAMKENAVLFEKNSLILEAVENGVVDAGLINHYYWFELAEQKGADKMTSDLVWFESGDAGNLINVAGVGVTRESENANAFVAWLLSESAQRFFVERTNEYSLTGIPQTAGLTPLSEIESPNFDLSDLATLSVTLEMIRKAGLL